MLSGQVFGRGGMIAIPLPNIGSMRGASGRARKEPFPAPFVDPGAQPILRRRSVMHGMLGGDSIRVFRLERRQPWMGCAQRIAPTSRSMTEHDLNDLKDRLYRAFGVQVRDDLQVRAEIIIQAEPGRWAFTPNELSDLLDGLNAILLHSKPDAGWPFRLTLKQYIGLFTPIHHDV